MTSWLLRMRDTRRDDRGVTAIIVALSMVVMLSVAALAVDYGDASSQRAKLQNAVDASALAIGRECATAPSRCTAGVADQIQSDMRVANSSTGTLTRSGLLGPAVTSTTVNGSKNVKLTLARAMGFNDLTVAARATARWDQVPTGTQVPGSPGTPDGVTGDEVFLPLGIPVCRALASKAAGYPTNEQLIRTDLFSELSLGNLLASQSCTNNGVTYRSPDRGIWLSGLLGLANASIAGNAIVSIDISRCRYAYNASALFSTIPLGGGVSSLAAPTGCQNKFRQVASARPTTYVFPVYESVGGTVGSLLNVRVVGFVKFKVTGIRMGGVLGLSIPLLFPVVDAQDPAVPCDTRAYVLGIPLGLNYCNGISGHFERGAIDGPGWKFAAPSNTLLNLGVVQVRLTR